MKKPILHLLCLSFLKEACGFQSLTQRNQLLSSLKASNNDEYFAANHQSRRNVIENAILATPLLTLLSEPSNAAGPAEPINYSPEFVQTYSDFTKTSEGWQFKDVKAGNGDSPVIGDRVVFDWSGYTIGYFGRPFEAKG